MTTGDQRPSRSPFFMPLLALASGVLIYLLYRVLAGYEVGGIGAPSDIGGGLIALLGLILIVIGLITLAVAAVRSRRS